MNLKETEATRYLCAAAYIDNKFREEVIQQTIKEKYRTIAVSPGVDLPTVVKHCLLAKRLELSRDVFLAILLVLALIKGFPLSLICAIAYLDKNFYEQAISVGEGVDSQTSQAEKQKTQKIEFKEYILSLLIFLLTFLYCFPLAYPLAFIIVCLWRWNISDGISRKFSKKHFKKHIYYFLKNNKWMLKKLSKISNYETSNVIVYGKSFYPFIGAGSYYSGWSFSLTLRKAREDTEGILQSVIFEQEEAVYLDLEELYNYVTDQVISLNLNGLTITDKLCVNGQEIRERPFVSHPLSCPESHLDDSVVNFFLKQNTNENIRYYKQIQVVLWNGQIVFSVFFRFVKINQKLFIEAVYFLLPPVKEEYQDIDKISSELRIEKINKFLIKALCDTLFLFPFSLLNLYNRLIVENWHDWRQHRQMKRQIRETANFNYGATKSIREEASITEYAQYFQSLDTQMYYKIINQQIIDSLCEFLERKNIDTSDLKEKSKVIFNSGVIVSGSSSINTQNLAVGDQSQAVTNNFAPSPPLGGTASDK